MKKDKKKPPDFCPAAFFERPGQREKPLSR
jgi:hypothetical protein